MIPGITTGRRRFSDLSEQEVLALAISNEEDDARIYRQYAQRLREEYPEVQIRSFPPAVVLALREAYERLLAKQAASDPLAQEIIRSLESYRETVRDWTLMSDRAFLETVTD